MPTLPDQSVTFFSPRAVGGLAARARYAMQGAVYHANRPPTLNELHRGFRVGNVVTNPNPLLDPETLTGVEGGVLAVVDEGLGARDRVLQHSRRRHRQHHAVEHADADHPRAPQLR